MSSLVVVASETYTGAKTDVSTELDTLNASKPISLLATVDSTFACEWAREWAVTNGIPFQDLDRMLIKNNGIDPIQAPRAAMLRLAAASVLTLGTHPRVTAAAGAAKALNLTLTQI
jgi:hypothetical protein